MSRIIGFDYIVHKDDHILILGSMPSVVSLEQGMYYANASNRFWKVLEEIYHMPVQTKEEKLELLKEQKIALWDICHSCIRKGSSDSSIKEIIANDIPQLLKDNPSIEKIICNGKTSYQLLQKYYALPSVCCPSTSSANAKFKLEDLVKIYKGELL
ncbi:DNA-deoxyinosine glycosylase [Floccifex sp.]|uniref:DNA-deoxyinosine glycosylase n=1 Tax=Floccifex sp. TaxID=2815810 RepID=UPI003F02C739